MRPILDLLNQPIVLTIITLAIGGYLISAIADHRARKDKLREKAIDFLADIGNVLNAFISSMYGPLITKDPYNEQAFKDSFKALFAKRMSVRVASEAPRPKSSVSSNTERGSVRHGPSTPSPQGLQPTLLWAN